MQRPANRVRYWATGALGLTVVLGAAQVSAEPRTLRDVDYSATDAAKTGGWVDDGAWMNSPTTFGLAKDPKTGNTAYTFTFRGRSQIYHPLPALTKDKVYRINIELKADGQVEGYRFYFRTIRPPWTSWGGGRGQSLGPTRTTFSAQLRMKEDMQRGQVGLFFAGRGSGKVHVYRMTIRELDDFVEDKQPVQPGSLLANAHFDCMDAGWVLHGDARWSPGRMSGPGRLSYRDPVALHVGVPYVFEIRGTPGLRFSYRIGMGRDAIRGGGRLRNGRHVEEFRIEQPYYGSKLEAVRRPLSVTLRTAEEGDDCAITKLSIYRLRETSGPECGFRFADEVRAAEHLITLGRPVEFAFGTRGIPEGAKAVVEVRDYKDRNITGFPVQIKRQENGVLGGRCIRRIAHTGWMYVRLKYDGHVVDGFPGELVIVPPKPSDGKHGDFVLGSHLAYDKPGTGGPPSRGADLRLNHARLLGITAERMHTRWVRWWFVEKQRGTFVYNDWKQNLPLAHGVAPLGMLDGTARWASSAPADIRATPKNEWPKGWGAYPAQNTKDWQDYVTKMVTHYRGRVRYWEVWNEPDHMFLQINPACDKDRQSAYMRLLKGAYAAAKKADPECKIVAGAVTAGGTSFLLRCIEDGMLDSCDVVSFHGYGRIQSAPSAGAAAFGDILTALRGAMRERGKMRPIWDTESGFGIVDGIEGAASSEMALKAILSERAAGIRRQYLYSGYPKNYAGHDGFRMHVGYAQRPLVIQGLLAGYDRLLGNASFTGNLGDDAAGLHVYAFADVPTGRRVIAGWCSGKEAPTTFARKTLGHGRVLDAGGNECGEYSDGELKLKAEVQYFVPDR